MVQKKNPRLLFSLFLKRRVTYWLNLIEANFFWLQLCIHHVLILVMLCTRVSKNGERLNMDCILNVNYAYQFYWCQFFVIIITIIVRILSLTSPFLSFKSSHSMEQKLPHILSILKLLYIFFLGLKMKIRASEWQHFTVYRSTFVKVETYFHFSFFCDDVQ